MRQGTVAIAALSATGEGKAGLGDKGGTLGICVQSGEPALSAPLGQGGLVVCSAVNACD